MDLEDFEGIERARVVADRACGWNGSLTPWRAEQHDSTPCPPDVRQRLKRLRDAAELRAAEQRKRGLCI